MPSPDDATARAKRATHRIDYTPELIAELRRLYETTPQTCERIAATGGISRPTLRSLAKREGWVRFAHRPLDLSAAIRLDARLAEAEAQLSSAASPSFPLPTRALASGGEGSGVGGSLSNREAAPPTPNPSPPFALQMGGGESAADPHKVSNFADAASSDFLAEAASGDFDSRFQRIAASALSEAEAQIAALKAARLLAEETGQHSKLPQFTRELQAVTNSLYRIKRIHAGTPDGALTDDDNLCDLDARRDALAKRIEIIVAEWRDAEAAGQAERT